MVFLCVKESLVFKFFSKEVSDFDKFFDLRVLEIIRFIFLVNSFVGINKLKEIYLLIIFWR